MTAKTWIVLLTTCFMYVSSKDRKLYDGEHCKENLSKTHQVGVQFGSHVLLPCTFSANSREKVKWCHNDSKEVVHLSINGYIKFMDHRYGRVKVFPNQASEGNYSISVDDLIESDLGSYRCRQGDFCHHVELFIETRSLSEDTNKLIVICFGVALLILACVGTFCCCYRCIVASSNKTDVNRNKTVITVATQSTVSSPGSVSSADDCFVYENDDQCPTRDHSIQPQAMQDPAGPQPCHSSHQITPNELNSEKVENHRRKTFHKDVVTWFRESTIRRHYYVNQAELNQEQAMAARAESRHKGGVKKKRKTRCQITNPIYNSGMNNLNQM